MTPDTMTLQAALSSRAGLRDAFRAGGLSRSRAEKAATAAWAAVQDQHDEPDTDEHKADLTRALREAAAKIGSIHNGY